MLKKTQSEGIGNKADTLAGCSVFLSRLGALHTYYMYGSLTGISRQPSTKSET